MDKSPDAFRTISEVAEWLGTPTHVLRFWESRFTQVKPVKRAGGRRYYRPADMALLGGIKRLLHEDGMTIRGVQKLLREEGVKHVATLSAPLGGGDPVEIEDIVEGSLAPNGEIAELADTASAEDEETPVLIENVVSLDVRAQTDQEDATEGNTTDDIDTPPEVATGSNENVELETDAAQASDADAEPASQVIKEEILAPKPEPAEPAPILVDVPDDPADNEPPPTETADLVASLRRAKSGSGSIEPTPIAIGEIYKRLKALRERMGKSAKDSATD